MIERYELTEKEAAYAILKYVLDNRMGEMDGEHFTGDVYFGYDEETDVYCFEVENIRADKQS